MTSRYHLFDRKMANGTYWYYWFMVDGKQVKKATGCSKKRDAEAFIERLERGDEVAEIIAGQRRAKFKDIASPMFLAGAAHLERWARKDRALKDQTVEQHRRWVDLYLIPEWGEAFCDTIQAPAFEDWLSEVPSTLRGEEGRALSGSTRNSIARTFLLIMKEARRAGYVERVPELELDRRHSRKKDILLDDELEKLFPASAEALILAWRHRPKNVKRLEEPNVALMFASLFCLMVSAGLRPGEARAVYLDQLYREAGGMIVDRAYDDRNELGAPKKSREDDPRFRVAYIPERSWKILDLWLTRRVDPLDFPGLVFPYHGKPIGTGYLADRMCYALENTGVDIRARALSPHSCRYTYDTKMKHLLPPGILREFIGHRSEQMTEHYDRMTMRPALESRLAQLADQRPAVERFWERKKG